MAISCKSSTLKPPIKAYYVYLVVDFLFHRNNIPYFLCMALLYSE